MNQRRKKIIYYLHISTKVMGVRLGKGLEITKVCRFIGVAGVRRLGGADNFLKSCMGTL